MKYAHLDKENKILGWYADDVHSTWIKPVFEEKVVQEETKDDDGNIVQNKIIENVLVKDGYYDISKIPTPNIEVTDEQWQIAINSGHNKVNADGTTELFDFRTPEEIAQQIEDAKPKSITKIQAMRQLKSMNLWTQFQTILASNADANDEWTLALSLDISDPFIAEIGTALGITDMQTLFNEASLL